MFIQNYSVNDHSCKYLFDDQYQNSIQETKEPTLNLNQSASSQFEDEHQVGESWGQSADFVNDVNDSSDCSFRHVSREPGSEPSIDYEREVVKLDKIINTLHENLSSASGGDREAILAQIERENKKRVVYQTNRLSNFLKNIPEFKDIPHENLYRLFIDAKKWDSSDEMEFDKREVGYMSAMMDAFIWMFNPGNIDRVSEEFYLSLHDRAVTNVFDEEHMPFSCGYRTVKDGMEGFQLTTGEYATVSETGINELINKRETYFYEEDGDRVYYFQDSIENPMDNVVFTPPPETLPKSVIEINVKIIRDKSKGVKQLKPKKINEEDSLEHELVPVVKISEIDRLLEGQVKKEQLFQVVFKTEYDFNYNDIASSLYKEYTSIKKAEICYQRKMLSLKTTRPATCQRNVQDVFDRFHSEPINAVDDEEMRLRKIVLLCQNLDQLHVFVDGNIRTAGILLINKLLLENGLTPCCFSDPNCLDCLSIDEIVERVIEGQQNFKSLMNSQEE